MFDCTTSCLGNTPPLVPYSEEDVELFAGRPFAVRHRHVLGVLKHPAVQEEDAFRRLLLLKTVQREVHSKIWTGNGETKR